MKKMFFDIIDQFQIEGKPERVRRLTKGLIHESYYVKTKNKEYFLQKMNVYVFTKPHELMKNIHLITSYLKKNGYHTLSIIPTKLEKNYLFDYKTKEYYRMYEYINDVESFEHEVSSHQLLEAGRVIGEFQCSLAKLPAKRLSETIPFFHNTPKRLSQLEETIATLMDDERLSHCKKELQYIRHYEEDLSELQIALENGKIPLRIVHNDTKLNNILYYKKKDKACCLIDLDTVMPGISLFDYADALRTTAATEPEDVMDATLMDVDEKKFSLVSIGYLSKMNLFLNDYEKNHLLLAFETITLELAIRFLTDYLEKDCYFHIDYPEHNLIRARAQIALHKAIIKKKPRLRMILQKIFEKLPKE